VAVAEAGGIAGEEVERSLLRVERPAEAAMEGDVARDLILHTASPGQSWATFNNIGTSTLA